MSGIVAIMSLDGRPVPPELPRAQLAAIAHRGEWEPRLWEATGIALGHVNLPRTPEAEREFLPASDRTGRYWITWDGRLDNRDELAGKLGYDAVERAEKTDADYVLDAFVRWGDDCVHQLLGDWAVVIWDNEARRLFCAKDPVGYRQMFFRTHEGQLIVGSEPQQLFGGCNDLPAPDPDYTERFLAAVMQRPGATWLDGVSHLAGGQTLCVDTDGPQVEAFWTQPRITKRAYRQPEDYVDEFVETFDGAVRARLRTNTSVGIYLSGGIDSSYVAAVARKLGAAPTALTSYAPGTKRMDERHYATLVASHLGLSHVETDISDCWTFSSRWLPDTVFDGPFHPAQGANQRRMGLVAQREGLGVVLGGEGGDEWCNGPETYLSHTLASFRLPTAWRLSRLQRSRVAAMKCLLKESYHAFAPASAQGIIAGVRGRGVARGRQPDSPDGWTDIIDYLRTASRTDYAAYQRVQWDVYRQINWLEPSWRDRHEASPNGVERRPPFFDLRVVELLASTPPWMKRFRGRRKDILREAESRLLPRVIADRMDWGLYDELYKSGLERETERVSRAVESVVSLTGRPLPPAVAEGLYAQQMRVNMGLWRTISTGLWLSATGVPASNEHVSPRRGSPQEQEPDLYLTAERR